MCKVLSPTDSPPVPRSLRGNGVPASPGVQAPHPSGKHAGRGAQRAPAGARGAIGGRARIPETGNSQADSLGNAVHSTGRRAKLPKSYEQTAGLL